MKRQKLYLRYLMKKHLTLLKNLKDVYIKVSCSEADNLNIINKSIKYFKKVFINFSGFEINEIEYVLKKLNIKKNYIFMDFRVIHLN